MTWAWPGRGSAAGWGCAGRASCSSRVAPARPATCRCRPSDGPVTTVEGLPGGDGRLHPVQQAFIDEQAAQCGYCTSGMVMAAVGLLRDRPAPTEQEVREALDGNLCRCGAHGRIIRAVQKAAGQTSGGSAVVPRPAAGQVLASQVPAGGTQPGEGPMLAPPSGSPRPLSPSPACRQASPRSRRTWRRTRCWPGGWISAGTGRSRSGSARWSTARASGPRWRRWPRRNSRSRWPGCGWPRCPPAPARTRASRRAACRSRTPARRSGRRARRPVTCCWTPLRPGSGSPMRRWRWPTGRSGRPTVRPG